MSPQPPVPFLDYRTGPFNVRLKTNYADLIEQWHLFYQPMPVSQEETVFDFHIELHRPRNLRRWIRPQIHFSLDGVTPFEPFPLNLAFPLLEWGMNWSIATRANAFLMLHSAVLEKGNLALILPALPGAGKSTLCAALTSRGGWRLLSDEFGLISPVSGRLNALGRPIVLKNESIKIIRQFAHGAVIGPLFPGTRKGTVAHLRPPEESLARQHESTNPGWVVFPQYRPGAATQLQALPQSQAFIRLANNSFNYHLMGETGFLTLSELVRRCDCYQLIYSRLPEALQHLDGLPPPRSQ